MFISRLAILSHKPRRRFEASCAEPRGLLLKTEMRYDSRRRKISMAAPDMGTWSYAYDANGNQVT